jgi:hypothetical protein
MPPFLILTVGTGTAGKHSDVAQGLANTIRQVQPRKFWLVPSASDKSNPVADLIRETVADLDSFAHRSESAPYHAIANHDEIHERRRRVREVIAAAKHELRQDERLPTAPSQPKAPSSLRFAGALQKLRRTLPDSSIRFTIGNRHSAIANRKSKMSLSVSIRVIRG